MSEKMSLLFVWGVREEKRGKTTNFKSGNYPTQKPTKHVSVRLLYDKRSRPACDVAEPPIRAILSAGVSLPRTS